MIHIELKDHVLVVRGGEEFKEWGDPYEFVCIVEAKGETAYVTALAGKIPQGFLGEITERLMALGFKRARWERIKSGKIKKVDMEG